MSWVAVHVRLNLKHDSIFYLTIMESICKSKSQRCVCMVQNGMDSWNTSAEDDVRAWYTGCSHEVQESFGHKHCLNQGKVSTDFWQKWWAHMHWVTSGNSCIRIPTCSGEAWNGNQGLKIHNQGEIFGLLCGMSTRSLSLIISRTVTILILLVIQLNIVALKESESPCHGHYQLYPIV